MSKRKTVDKAEARERRNRLLDNAAAGRLSLTEGVRGMRAIAGMTQEEFAQHRGVSARVIKALELDQSNPTVATLNRIGAFFGLEVAFVPIRRDPAAEAPQQPATAATEQARLQRMPWFDEVIAFQKMIQEAQEEFGIGTRMLAEQVAKLDKLAGGAKQGARSTKVMPESAGAHAGKRSAPPPGKKKPS